MGCIESNPIVHGMEKDYSSRIDFARLDVSTAAAKELMARWGVKLNSTYLIFDKEGREVWRSSRVPFPHRKAREVLDGLLG